MVARLPVPGSDNGTWGSILNTYLGVAHNSDGTLITSAVQQAGALIASNNLSDTASPTTARTNLGLGSAATQNKVAAGSAGVLDATDPSTTNARAPSGTAGGDLSGTYPNPAVSKLNGISVSGTPSTGQLLTATGTTAATWQTGPFVPLQLGASNGTDDTSWINTILAAAGAGSYVRGTPGQTYLISAPLKLRPGGNTTLDMTGCTIAFANTSVRTNMLNNGGVTPDATATDVTTTAASAVITSPQLIAAGAAVGMQVGVVGAGVDPGTSGTTSGPIWFYDNIQSISGNNITLGGKNIAGNQAQTTLANATAYLFKTRDTNITVIGGTWAAGTNWNVWADRYNAGYNSDLLRFRRVDGLTVRNVLMSIDYAYASSGMGWCFGIAPADCSEILIDNIRNAPGAAAPTFVNSSGLVQKAIVRNIIGTSYDDMVAFGAVGARGDDIEGDIGDVLIDGVFSVQGGPAAWNQGSNCCVDLYTGHGSNNIQRVIWDVDVRSCHGITNTWPLRFVPYPSGTNGAGSILVDVKNIWATSSNSSDNFINIPAAAGATVTGPNAGADLAEAQITANSAATGPAVADVAGLSITFNAPPSGAVWLEAWGYSIAQGTSAGGTLMYITDSSNNIINQCYLGTVAAGGYSTSPFVKVRVTGLICGTSYTYKVRMSSSAGTQSLLAGATYPAYIRASVAS